MIWHLLDVGSVWMREFASALSCFVPCTNWSPVMRNAGALERWEREEEVQSPPLRIRHFPLQRGYSRFPISTITSLGSRQTARMLRLDGDGGHSPLICSTPYYAAVAEKWPGPVVYYQTDLTYAYHGVDPHQIRTLDTRLCRVATAVCPNSRRIAHYMVSEAGCDPGKIVIVPNATREANILEQPPTCPGPAPADLADLARPFVGVLGNLAANLDWCLLLDAVEQTRDMSWVFVGPYEMEVHDLPHRTARERLLRHGGRVRFVGSKPYGLLQEYARTLDVAVLPYRRKEPTFSGSSTRFYEHLAACRPMLATRGFEELLHLEPLLRLVNSGTELAEKLNDLQATGFEDGWTEARWQASRTGTWSARAATLIRACEMRSAARLPVKQVPEFTQEVYEQGRYLGSEESKFSLVQPN